MEEDPDKLRPRLRWLLAALTGATYWRVAFHGFINYDDPIFVTANPHVYTGFTLANLKWAFTALSGDATSYQPLTWLTHQLDCQFFGLQAGAHHLTNLWLHVANTVLLFTVLDKLTGKHWRSVTVASLFALHPLHVQTVAWISERKSLLCTLFWLLTTLAYLRYVHRCGTLNYMLVLLSFTAALLSKPISVSLPITLLLLDFWPLGRWKCTAQAVKTATTSGEQIFRVSNRGLSLKRLLFEKAPLFLLSGLACWVTVLAQRDLGAILSIAQVPVSVRLRNSLMACAIYLRKVLWPVDLAPIYPLRYDWAWSQVAGSGALLFSISLWVARGAKARPYLLVGWCWYLVTLIPTLGFVQVGLQGMADRYTYVPLIGVFLMAVWEIAERIAEHRQAKAILAIGAVGVTAACILCTIPNVEYWQTSTRLFEHAVRVTRRNFLAYSLLGMARQNDGDLRGAESQYREAIKIDAKRAPTHRLLANVLFQEGDSQGAFDQFSLALKLMPADPQAHRNLAELFMRSPDVRFHNPRKALQEARIACELNHYRKREFAVFLAQVCAQNHEERQARDAAQKALALSVGPQEILGAAELLTNICSMARANSEDIHGGIPDTH